MVNPAMIHMTAAINLWNPGHLSVALILPTAFLLGMVHGVTPDEHTWPITFSYSVGSYSSKGGRKMGFLFSLAFTLQRAIAAELAFLTLSKFQFATRWGFEVYIVVGTVMLLSGLYILRWGRAFRLGRRRADGGERDALRGIGEPAVGSPESTLSTPRQAPLYMPLVHGFIAGWGVGAFAVIIYTVLAPGMPSAWVGWVPGALFGVGTMVMQIILGSLFGAWMARRNLSDRARVYVARKMSGRTLSGGGIVFVVIGVVGLAIPSTLSALTVVTPIRVHNLHTLGTGFFLAVIALFAIAAWAFAKSTREARSLPTLEPATPALMTAEP